MMNFKKLYKTERDWKEIIIDIDGFEAFMQFLQYEVKFICIF